MTLTLLRDDALRATAEGFELLVALPWIRSLPLESLQDVRVELDGSDVPVDLGATPTWWNIQDRLSLRGAVRPTPGTHVVSVAFALVVPYLPGGSDGPLMLPFRETRDLEIDAPPSPPVARAGARLRPERTPLALPSGWQLTASAFNWTPDVVRKGRRPDDVAIDIVRRAVADTIEVEAGQIWRSFPELRDSEIDAFRHGLEAAGGHVSIVGASIDDWAPDGRRRDVDERLAFLLPQLRAASRVGARGVRLPLGQAGPDLLRRVQPELHDLDITLYEEAQGHQTPAAAAAAYDALGAMDDPRIRLLVDISMLMPALPTSYLSRLRAAGIPDDLLHRLETAWRDPATSVAVVDLLRAGGVPAAARTLYMNLLVRFGRSDAADLRSVLPLVGGIHLKFWDLDDADGRVSRPVGDIGHELRASGFRGTLCSEWGGHEWLDEDPEEMTRRHLSLAAGLLARPAASVR